MSKFDSITPQTSHHHTYPPIHLSTTLSRALAASLSGDTELDAKAASFAVVGIDCPYTCVEGAAIQPYLDMVEVDAEGEATTDASIEAVDI